MQPFTDAEETSFEGYRSEGFRILEELDAGGQGRVYKAICEKERFEGLAVGAVVVLKEMSENSDDGRKWARLVSRTNDLVSLTHDCHNIVRYYGCFRIQRIEDDLYVVIQEFLGGETLKSRLKRECYGLDIDECKRIVLSVLDGLECAWKQKQLVHRDIKPSNIFLCTDGSVKLIDFEIAKQADYADDVSSAPTNVVAVSAHTHSTNAMQGSYDYMAPDFMSMEFTGDVISDIFSLGVVAYEIVTNALPYKSANRNGSMMEWTSRWRDFKGDVFANESPIQIATPARIILGQGGKDVLGKALAPDRSRRYSDLSECKSAFQKMVPRVLEGDYDKYEIHQWVGKGGYGMVFKALRQTDRSPVAVKNLSRDFGSAGKAEKKFRKEANVLRRLTNSGDYPIVRFVDFCDAGASGNSLYLVMEFLDGMPGNSLREVIRRKGENRHAGKPDGMDGVLAAFERYAYGLQVMHEEGVWHRDIKPDNLYYPADSPERAVIMDLGIAHDPKGTTTHVLEGTWEYAPPEVFVKRVRSDAKGDIYALGLCLYEAVSGDTSNTSLPDASRSFDVFLIQQKRAEDGWSPQFDVSLLGGNKGLQRLLEDMTKYDPSSRIDAADAVARLRSLQGKNQDDYFILDDEPPGFMGRLWDSCASLAGRVWYSGRHVIGRKAAYAAVGGICLVCVASFLFCWPALKLKIAQSELDRVIAAYRNLERYDGSETLTQEADWRIRFGPNSDTIFRLSPSAFRLCQDRLNLAKTDLAGQPPQLDPPQPDPPPPAPPQPDPSHAEGERKLTALTNECWKLIRQWEPISQRRKRLDEVQRKIEKAKDASYADGNAFETILREVGERRKWIVGAVSNSCAGAVSVAGKSIGSGGSEVFEFTTGKLPELWTASRDGYEAFMLPKRFDGVVVELREKDFTPTPRPPVPVPESTVTVVLPALSPEVTCFVDGIPRSGSFSLRRTVLSHECVFVHANANFSPQTNVFSVLGMKEDVKLPGPGTWKLTPQAKDRNQAALTNECWTLIRQSEPVSLRRERLSAVQRKIDEARRASYVDEDVYRSLMSEVAERRKWIVGVVSNGCVDVVSVLGVDIRPRDVRIFEFKSGTLPDIWCASRDGHEAFKLPRIFDGKEVKIFDGDFKTRVVPQPVPKPTPVPPPDLPVRVSCSIPPLPEGAKCFIGGNPVEGSSISLEPGNQIVCTYRRRGYDDVKKGYKVTHANGQVLPAPGDRDWVLVPIEVAVRSPTGTTCFIDGKEVRGKTLKFKPGSHVVCVYKREGYADVTKTYEVTHADWQELPFPTYPEWIPLAIDVAVPPLPDGATCLIDGKEIKGESLRLKPGIRVLCMYKRAGYADVKKEYKVTATEGQVFPSPAPAEWELLSVRVAIPPLPEGTICLVNGQDTKGHSLMFKPGDYVVCVYRKEGFEDIAQNYPVTMKAEQTFPPPPENGWIARFFNVAVPPLPEGVECAVDGEVLRGGSVSRRFGHLVMCTYSRRGYKDVVRQYRVSAARNQVLPKPTAGDWELEAVRLMVPEAQYDVRCKIDGEPVSVGKVFSRLPGDKVECRFERDNFHPISKVYAVTTAPRQTVPVPEDQEWIPLTVRTAVPRLEEGVICKVDKKQVTSGQHLQLTPGEHECVYMRADFKPQVSRFIVSSGRDAIVPSAREWEECEDFIRLKKAADAMDNVESEVKGIDATSSNAEQMIQGEKASLDDVANEIEKVEETLLSGDSIRLKQKISKRIGEAREKLKTMLAQIEAWERMAMRADEAKARYDEKDLSGALEEFYKIVEEGYLLSDDEWDIVDDSYQSLARELNDCIERWKRWEARGRHMWDKDRPSRTRDGAEKELNLFTKWYIRCRRGRRKGGGVK